MEWHIEVWRVRIALFCEVMLGLAKLLWVAVYSVALFFGVLISTTFAMLALASLWH